MRSELAVTYAELSNARGEIDKLGERLYDYQTRDAQRYDKLLEKQTEILDSRLGLNTPASAPDAPRKSLPRRMSFAQVRQDFEKRTREDHWRKQIEIVEKKDKQDLAEAVANVSPGEK